MKINTRIFSLLFLVMIAFSGYGCSNVPTGNVGIKVYLLGSNKGVDHEELGPGRYWIGVNEQLFIFPTYTQNYVWTASKHEGSPNDESITFQTVEGMSVGADVGVSYHIDPKKVGVVFQKYRKGVDEITHVFLRNTVRDAFVRVVSEYPVDKVYGNGKADILTKVEKMVNSEVNEQGIVVEHLYLVGDPRLPPSVITAINDKIQATQKAQMKENEVREATAEANKVMEKAKGESGAILMVAKSQAEANKILAASISPELVRYRSIEKWDGVMPKITGEATPMINMDLK